MSESEGTKELSGIARSVDALFSPNPASATDVVDEGDAPPVADAPSAEEPELSEDPELSVDPEPSGDPELSEEPEFGAEPELSHDSELSEDPSSTTEPALSDGPPADGADLLGGFDLVPEDSDAPLDIVDEADDSLDVPGPADVRVTRPDRSDASEPVSMDDMAPSSPLQEAVEALLAGDAGRAEEVERLANEMLENRDLDGVARAVGRLAAGAGDPVDGDVLAVARAIATPMVYGRLARQMGSEREEERRKVNFLACRNLGEPMAAAIRDDLAESTDRLARRIHCEALVEMGPTGRKVIEEMAVDENRFLVRNAVAILGDTGGDRAVELVTTALANPDAKVRKEALRSLAKLGDEDSGELVLGLLEDPDGEVRISAAVAAGELHVERALRSLIKMLDDTSDPDEAIPLVRALGQLGDPGAVTSIEKHAVPKLFSKPRTDVRIAAYRALNHIGTPHARRLLNQAMDDKNGEVKAAVKDMLGMR